MGIETIKIILDVLGIVGLILFIIVLIKQFKKGGVLQGILGIITCGLWTFIWGWIKHNQHGLTRLMLIWTLIFVAEIAVVAFALTTFGLEFAKMAKLGGKEIQAELKKKKSNRADIRKKMKRSTQPSGANGSNSGQDSPQGKPGADPVKLASAAMSLWQNGRYADPEQAVDNWSKIIAAQPNSAEAYNNRGVGHYNAKRYLEAINDYDQAIRLKANYAVAFNNRGNARYAMAKYPEALADYSASLRLDPKYANAHSNRGLAHYRLNEQSKACEEFQKSCELDDCEMMKWAMSVNICK